MSGGARENALTRDGYARFATLEQDQRAGGQLTPIQHWAYHTETPFRPVHELLEMAQAALAPQAGMQEEITWSGSGDQLAFREAVLQAHLDRSRSRKGPPGRDLSGDELAPVAGTTVQMRREAAEAAGRLIAAANEALTAAKQAGHADALKTRRVTVASGYRGSEHQARLWRRYFLDYYRRTARHREALPSGPHGPEAVSYMIKGFGIPKWIAAPGYSNHQSGIAIDLQQERVHGAGIRNSSRPAARTAWRGTWLYDWLVQSAGSFGFRPYEREPWHWEYRPAAPAQETIPAEEDEPVQEPEALGLDEKVYHEEAAPAPAYELSEFEEPGLLEALNEDQEAAGDRFLDVPEADGTALGGLGAMEPVSEEGEGLFDRENAMSGPVPADGHTRSTALDQDQRAEGHPSPTEHRAYRVETPFRPVHELLEAAAQPEWPEAPPPNGDELGKQGTDESEDPDEIRFEEPVRDNEPGVETESLPDGLADSSGAELDELSGMRDRSVSGELVAEVTDAVDRLLPMSAWLEDEGTFSNLGRFLGDVAARLAVRHAINRGERREYPLADVGYRAKYPSRPSGLISKDDPGYTKLRDDWRDVLNRIVRPALREAAAKLDRLVRRDRPPPRLCCLLMYHPLHDPGSIGGHGDHSEVLGYVFTRRLGFIDLGHARETADVTMWALTQLQDANGTAASVVELVNGTARLLRDMPPEQRLALAQQLAYVDSVTHEIETWGIRTPGMDNSSFSPEDLPSNLFGTLVAAAAFWPDGGTNAAMTTQLGRLLGSADAQPQVVGNAARDC